MKKQDSPQQKYADLGWRVLPLHAVERERCCTCRRPDCSSPGKHPRIKSWQNRASANEITIREWWSRWPNANTGIATGRGSGFFVLDVDTDRGGDESLHALEASHGS